MSGFTDEQIEFLQPIRAKVVKMIQDACRIHEEEEERLAVAHVRKPADKDLLQEAVLASKGARVATYMRDAAIMAVNANWPNKVTK